MASAWGKSWGKAWGNAWGPVAAVNPAPQPPIYPGSGGWAFVYPERQRRARRTRRTREEDFLLMHRL